MRTILKVIFLFIISLNISCATGGGWEIIRANSKVYYSKKISLESSGERKGFGHADFQALDLSASRAKSLGYLGFTSDSNFMGVPIKSFNFIPDMSRTTIDLSNEVFEAYRLNGDEYIKKFTLWKTKLGTRNPLEGVPIEELNISRK